MVAHTVIQVNIMSNLCPLMSPVSRRLNPWSVLATSTSLIMPPAATWVGRQSTGAQNQTTILDFAPGILNESGTMWNHVEPVDAWSCALQDNSQHLST